MRRDMKKIVRKQKLLVAVDHVRSMSEQTLAGVVGGRSNVSYDNCGTQTQISYCTACVNG